MTIESFLSIASFALSVGGLVLFFLYKDPSQKKWVAVGVVVALLVATTGISVYQNYRHNQLISRIEKEIIAKLSHNTWTFDQLYQELHFEPFPVVNEALFDLVEKGVIGHRVIEFRDDHGSMLQARGYYLASY